MHNTTFSAAVTAARLAAGQPVSTAALAHMAKVEAEIKQVKAAR